MKIINDAALDKFRGPGRCEFCRFHFSSRDPHHVESKGIGGGKHLDIASNLVSLCRTCHSTKADTPEGKDRCIAIIANREKGSPSDIERVHRFILGLDKHASVDRIEEGLMGLPGPAQRIARRELREAGIHG